MQENRTKKSISHQRHPRLLAALSSVAVAGAVVLGCAMPTVALAETTDVANKENVYRLWSPETDEHLYTSDFYEVTVITQEGGWRYEGVGFTASSTEGQPVYRLYNTKTNRHLWTTDAWERHVLLDERSNWNDEGIAWYGIGENKMTRLYNPKTDQHLYTRDTYEVSVITKGDWRTEPEAGTWSIVSETDYVPIKGTWIVSDSWTPGSFERYWIAADGNLAKSRYIDPVKNLLDVNAGYRAYATETGLVVRGAYKIDDNHAIIADKNGKVATGMANGFVTTADFAGSVQTYYFENDLARIGLFEVGGKEYLASPETGALVKNGTYTDTSTGMTYQTDAQGVVSKKEVANYGDQIAALAVAVATGQSGNAPRNTSANAPFTTISDSRVAKWNSLVDETLGAFDGNQAYSSCAQAVAAVVGATVDPDIAGELSGKDAITRPSGDFDTLRNYLAEHPEMYKRVTSAADVQPGDILYRPGHVSIYVGSKAAESRFPGAGESVFQASYPIYYPDISRLSKEDAFKVNTYVYHVIAKNSSPKYPFIDTSKYLK